MNKINNNNIKLSFSAIDPYLEKNKQEGTEKEVSGQGFVYWGDNNKYPSYLNELYNKVPTLQSIINTCVDYTVGNGVNSIYSYINDDDAENIILEIAKSYFIYGGFALNILRNRLGDIAKICVMDFKKLRVSKDGKIVYYAEDYDKRQYSRCKWEKYPSFDANEKQNNSIFYFKNSKYTHYPIPVYGAAITACEIEKSIDDYHLNSINNGFMGSVLVSLNNGIPTEEIQKEIENLFNEKFCGKENASRMVISYANDKDHQATIEKIDTEDFSERYKTLADRSKQSIFTSFRCTPTLCGIPTENNGFSSEQYNEQFNLFNKTVILPVQKLILRQLTKILGNNYFTIEPFTIDFKNTNKKETID